MQHHFISHTTKELILKRGGFINTAKKLPIVSEVQEENIRQLDSELLQRGLNMAKIRKPKIEIIKILK